MQMIVTLLDRGPAHFLNLILGVRSDTRRESYGPKTTIQVNRRLATRKPTVSLAAINVRRGGRDSLPDLAADIASPSHGLR